MTMFFNVEDIPCRTPLHHFQFGRCLYPNPIANPLYHFSHFTNKQTITKAWKLHLENRLFSPTSSAFFLHIGWMQNFEPTGFLDAPYPSSLTCRKGLSIDASNLMASLLPSVGSLWKLLFSVLNDGIGSRKPALDLSLIKNFKNNVSVLHSIRSTSLYIDRYIITFYLMNLLYKVIFHYFNGINHLRCCFNNL